MPSFDIFGNKIKEESKNNYTKKIEAPIYTPNHNKPSIHSLMDTTDTDQRIKEIKESNVSDEEKAFLIEAAKRHTIFDYSKIADYYSHADPEVQELMEKSALIIIDFKQAIKYGYAKLNKQVSLQYLREIDNDK